MEPDLITSRLRNILLIPLLLIVCLCACSSYEESKQRRAALAKTNQGPIDIAIVWPDTVKDKSFLQGVSLAVDQINNTGGILGRKINPLIFTEQPTAEKKSIAKKIVTNDNIVAVVGHISSQTAIPASITYEENGVLFLAPAATSPTLTAHNFQYVFRTTPSDKIYGRHIASFAKRRGYKKIVILDNNSIYGKSLADIVHAKTVDLGIEVVNHKAYFKWQHDYRNLINEFSKMEFDAVFLAGILPEGIQVIKQFREMGITVPFFTGDGFDDESFASANDKTVEGTVVPTSFNPYSRAQNVIEFSRNFQEEFSTTPDTWAAQGYDTIKLLAFAYEESKTTEPLVVSSTLRYLKDWQGVTGNYTFDDSGDIKEKVIYFKEVRNGAFTFLEE